MSAEPHPTLPPVRLHSDAELARDALAAPLFARAVRLARWAGPATRVDIGGELVADQVPEAVAVLGLDTADEDSPVYASQAWRVAVDTGLVDVTEPDEDEDGDGGPGAAAGEAAGEPEYGTAAPGEDLALLTGGAPGDVLDLWLAALDTVLADAAVPDLDDLVDALDAGGEIDFDQLDWNPRREADFLDAVLANLYLLTAAEGGTDGPVPLPVLAASMLVPQDMGEPTDAVLEQVSEAMMRLDDQFRQLEPIGLVEFRPVDEELMAEADDEELAAGGPGADEEYEDDGDISRYGMVRLTPLGLYGIRARLLEAGIEAPAVGELAGKGADVLLHAVSSYPERAAQAEIEEWLSGRDPAAAVTELLSAARGDDEGAPLRRLRCQQALALVPAGAAAGPAVRAVLDDPELGGLARVWLAERGATGVPAPDEAMVFWLTVDTIAAQLAADGETEELPLLMETLTAHHTGFFDRVWRVDHPATAYVLEAMGRLHPDRRTAKEARKAAFKARSRRP
ncbi:hypothetical protein [Streptomyces sp. NPDC051567]|uniref:hypothetical protein n=1 Tax=Streptomyces sp. NPDC051567 TaxID=3365660 RepID=UPI0037A2AF28